MGSLEEVYVLNRNLRKEKSYATLGFFFFLNLHCIYIIGNCELDFVLKMCIHNLGNL